MSAMLNRVSGSFRLPGSVRRPKRQRATMPTDFGAAVKKRALYGSKSLDRFERILLSIPNNESKPIPLHPNEANTNRKKVDEVNAELPWPDKYLQPQGSEEFTTHVMDMQWRIIKILAREHYGCLPSSKTVHFGRYGKNDLIDQTDRLPNGVNNHPIGGPVTMLADPEEDRQVRESFRPRFEAREAIKAAQREKAEAEKAEKAEEEERRNARKRAIEEAREAHEAQRLGIVKEEDEILEVEETPEVEEAAPLTTELTPEEEAWLWENRRIALRMMRSKDSGLNSAVGGVGGTSLPVIAETEALEIPVVYKDQEDVPVGELAGGRKSGRKASAHPEGIRRGISKRFSRFFRKRTA